MLELNVFEESRLQINKRIIYGKEAFLISNSREDIKCLRQENGIEESITTITRTLKRKMIDTFPEKIYFIQMGNT